MNDTKNFKVREFACKCCGKNEINQTVLNICQKIRDKLGVPVRVNSGYRCPKHNAEVGGVKNSYHTQGKAADLLCELGAVAIFNAVKSLFKSDPEFHDMLSYAILYRKKNFVHVDCGGKRKSGNVFEERK